MLVKSVMSRDVMTIDPKAKVREAARILADNRIGSLVVVKAGSVVGIITERDILLCIADTESENIDTKTIEDAMTNYIVSITPTSTVQAAIKLMAGSKIKKLPVMEGAKLVGIITASDIITAQPEMIKDIKGLVSRQ